MNGWKLVPVEPTEEMNKAGLRWLTGIQHMRANDKRNALGEAFKAMLAAAPQPPAGGEPVAWLAKTLKGSLAGTLGFVRSYQKLNPELYEGPFPVFRHAKPVEVESDCRKTVGSTAYTALQARLQAAEARVAELEGVMRDIRGAQAAYAVEQIDKVFARQVKP